MAWRSQKFHVYNKSNGEYLGQAELTARPEGEALRPEDLEFVPHKKTIKTEYIEEVEKPKIETLEDRPARRRSRTKCSLCNCLIFRC